MTYTYLTYQYIIVNKKVYIYTNEKYIGRVWIENQEVKAEAEKDVMWLPVMDALDEMRKAVR